MKNIHKKKVKWQAWIFALATSALEYPSCLISCLSVLPTLYARHNSLFQFPKPSVLHLTCSPAVLIPRMLLPSPTTFPSQEPPLTSHTMLTTFLGILSFPGHDAIKLLYSINIFLPLEFKPQEGKDCLLFIVISFLEISTMPGTCTQYILNE